MASKYWIKLYLEILDDPKMGRMLWVILKYLVTNMVFVYNGRCLGQYVIGRNTPLPTSDLSNQTNLGGGVLL